jgi:hypothetical protein
VNPAHASCAFKRRLWLTGGRSDLHPLYNLESSYKSADVWYSADGIILTIILEPCIVYYSFLNCLYIVYTSTRVRLESSHRDVWGLLCAEPRCAAAWPHSTMVLSRRICISLTKVNCTGSFGRYPRFSHTLNSFDADGDGEADYMLLMGGYAPTPINDVWVTEDGVTWA